jgi:type I restriction enzyme M protein
MNERITEDIVRRHFQNDSMFESITFEEQKTKIERIKNLLKTASKRGTGKPGYPEFIITFPSLMNVVLIVECKSELKDHQSDSKQKSNPEKFAVDGVLHYSKFLEKEFDVIALAVSGQNKDQLKVSNFIIAKDGKKQEIDKKLLSVYDYLSLIENENNAEKLKHQNILLTASKLNKKLYDYSVPENERATIVSGILIALQNDVFRKSFHTYLDPSQLVEDLLNNIERVLKKNQMGDKIPILMDEYRTIKKSSKLSKEKKIRNHQTAKEEVNTILRDLIFEINSKVFPFTSYENIGYDILGEFYSEFIRYTNGDRKLGLVLTPQHIADLFVDLANLDKDDILYDNCCGTAGFLIKGMKKLIQLAGNDTDKIQNIRSNQILGIEQRTDMFTYACSNMMMRGDGKSSIIQGDSFKDGNKNFIKSKKPTVGFLNPPYSTSIPELKFVYANLECLEKNAICISIVPFNSVLEDSGKNYEWKQKLLEKHTLEGVFTMPVETFYPIGAVTAIVVFKAHSPHPTDYETYFGYWREDGFVKQKPIGRIDKNGTWSSIKKNWLYNYRNRKIIDNESVMKHVLANDEWCAEAYLETDYSDITKEDFFKHVREFMIHKIRNLDF